MPRKPKQRVTVDLPQAVTDFMRDVAQQINDGDEAATVIESDDLLQCDCIYGGLYDVAGQRFFFQYFHTDDATWDMDLDAHQIAQIANGTITALDLWQCSDGTCECLYATEDSRCQHCDAIRHFDDYRPHLRIHHPDESPDILAVMVNLRKVGLALLDYHRAYEHFPPACTRDESGRPLHSWRALILPFLDEDSVFEKIDFGEPWDSKTNRRAWELRPSAFGGNDSESPNTHVVAVVGPDTIWPIGGKRACAEIKTGYSYTIAAVALPVTTVHWMQPIDTDVVSAISQYEESNQLIAVFVDGHVDIVQDVDASRLRKLLCI
jgi:hypothetical protein